MVVQVDVPSRESRGHRGPAGSVPYSEAIGFLYYTSLPTTTLKVPLFFDMAK